MLSNLLYCYSNVTGIEGDAVSGEDHSDRQWSKSMLHNLHYCANKERFDLFLFVRIMDFFITTYTCHVMFLWGFAILELDSHPDQNKCSDPHALRKS